MNELDPDVYYPALRSHDARFDGRFVVAVTSTGIYCRPICSAGPAKRQNCRFFLTAAAAQEAGFRPCLRCRPETAPSTGSWGATENTVTRALALIEEGALDESEASVDALAERLGVGERQLRRLFERHLGASPITVAQTRRVLFAKQLIHDTRLPMAEVALASGFGSVRRFNATFRHLFQRPPSALRRKSVLALPEGTLATTGVTVRLRYRPPFEWPAMLAHLRARALGGVEQVEDEVYRRVVRIGDSLGTVEVRHLPASLSLEATVRLSTVRALPLAVERVRRVFDLGADMSQIDAHLSQDRWLAPLVAERPGLRVPGGWDGFELGVRAVLGQQVTLEAGRRLTEQLVRLCGTPVQAALGLTYAFPTASQVAQANLSTLGMPGARKQAVTALAEAAATNPRLFEPADTVEETVARLRSIRGVGEWTAQYLALRAAREPDAFPASDVGLLRGATPRGGQRPSAAQLSLRAERWRPWRAYAAQHLWAAEGAAHD